MVSKVKFDDFDIMGHAWFIRNLARCRKKLGTVLELRVGDEYRYIVGYNGTPAEVDVCEPCRKNEEGFHSGEGLHLCPSVHAELRPILKAAKHGNAVKGGTLYCSFGIPCKDCLKELMIAGISEIVCVRDTYYDELSKEVFETWKKNRKFRVLDVMYCPKCYSLDISNIDKLHSIMLKPGDVFVECAECHENYIVSKTQTYVGGQS